MIANNSITMVIILNLMGCVLNLVAIIANITHQHDVDNSQRVVGRSNDRVSRRPIKKLPGKCNSPGSF